MAILRGIELTHTGKGVLSVRNWRKVMKAVFSKIGQHWAQRMLPRHFDHDARGRYGYQPRTVGWIKRKIRLMSRGKGAGVMDLVQTGTMKDWVLNTVKVTSGPTAAHVKASGPGYLTINPKPAKLSGRTMPNMVREISALTEEERAELIDVGEEALNEAWGEMPTTTERHVSVAGHFAGGD